MWLMTVLRMVTSPSNGKADLDRALNVDAPWPAMRLNYGDRERVLREVLLKVSWAAEQLLPDRREG